MLDQSLLLLASRVRPISSGRAESCRAVYIMHARAEQRVQLSEACRRVGCCHDITAIVLACMFGSYLAGPCMSLGHLQGLDALSNPNTLQCNELGMYGGWPADWSNALLVRPSCHRQVTNVTLLTLTVQRCNGRVC